MEKIEFKDCYVFKLECMRDMHKKSIFEVDLEDGITVAFGKTGRETNRNNIKLGEVIFSKDEYSIFEAENIWSSYEFRYLMKKYDYNRSIPLCHDIIKMKNGDYVAVIIRNTGKKMLLHEQIKMFEEGKFPADLILQRTTYLESAVQDEDGAPANTEQTAKVVTITNDMLPRDEHWNLIRDFEKLLKEYSKKSRGEEAVVQALSILNTISLSKMPSEEALMEFARYFNQRYGSNKKVFKEIDENWPGNGPRIFRLIDEADVKLFIRKFDKEYAELSSTKKKMIDKLVDFILSRPGWVQASVFYDFNDYNVYSIDEDEPDEYIAEYRKELRAEATKMLLEGAGMTIRYKDPKYPDREVVCGIMSRGMKFATLSAAEMKRNMENQPDGKEEFPMDLYQRADVIF